MSTAAFFGGKTGIIIGQDLFSILNYTTAFPNRANMIGVMSYTALKSPTGSLTGLTTPIDYGSGIEWARGLVNKYPEASLQLGLYLVDSCEDVYRSLLDPEIHKLIEFIDSIHSNDQIRKKTYLRIGYEFDYISNHYEPTCYIAAFQHIVKLFRAFSSQQSKNSVEFVWHSSVSYTVVLEKENVENKDNEKEQHSGISAMASDASSYTIHSAPSTPDSISPLDPFVSWYPGDEFVDWCGVSLFEQPYTCDSPVSPSPLRPYVDANGTTTTTTTRSIVNEERTISVIDGIDGHTAAPKPPPCVFPPLHKFATFCRDHNKPIMIAESTPFGGILEPNNDTETSSVNEAGYSGNTWDRWFVFVLQWIELYDIKLWSYINCNWDAQPMWASNHAPGKLWGDSTIQTHPYTKEMWEKYVLSSPRFDATLTHAAALTPSTGRGVKFTSGDKDYISTTGGGNENLDNTFVNSPGKDVAVTSVHTPSAISFRSPSSTNIRGGNYYNSNNENSGYSGYNRPIERSVIYGSNMSGTLQLVSAYFINILAFSLKISILFVLCYSLYQCGKLLLTRAQEFFGRRRAYAYQTIPH